jgi:DNA polymerase
MVIIDFETRSKADLLAVGTDKYASDPSTDILCMAVYDLDTDREWLWFPHDGELPVDLREAINKADLVAAHNARFDQLIWECVAVEDYDFPVLPTDVWYCTSAQCRVNALPASLDDAARALGLVKRKDHRGKALIRKLSIPNKATGEFNECAESLQAMGEYCLQDVRVTVDVVGATRILTRREHSDWLVNERINDRGVKVDLGLCGLAMHYAEQETAEIAQELTEATDYFVTKHTQSARIRDWLYDQLPEDHPALKLTVKHVKGERKVSMDKTVRADILNAADDQVFDLPDTVYNALSLVDDGNKSSVSKFKRMAERAEDDHRCRGSFVYAGAGQTLRYASRGLQLHNAKRDCWSAIDTEFLKDVMLCGGALRDPKTLDDLPVMDALAKLIRPAMIPDKGNVFVVGDWSQIEARCLPWLSDSRGGRAKLDVFASGEDVYTKAAESMGLDDRQLGKVAELACGFQGGVNAFNAMGRIYGVYLPEHQGKAIVQKWRDTNKWAVQFWDKLERAAISAVRDPGQYYPAGRVKYVYVKGLMKGTLMCILPDGTAIQYPFCRLETVQTKWGPKRQLTCLKASHTMATDAKEWPRMTLYGGILSQGATQATAAALLRHTLRQVADVVMHCHDEVIIEVPEKIASSRADELQAIMESRPAWADGLPLKAEPAIMNRYGKA